MKKEKTMGWTLMILPILIGIEEKIRSPDGSPIIWMWIVGGLILVTGIFLLVTSKGEGLF